MDGGRNRTNGRGRRATLVLLLAALMVAVTACAPGRKASPAPTKPAASQPSSESVPTPDLLCGGTSGRACQLSLFATEPDDGVGALTARLNQATVTIDYSPFLLDEPEIVRAL